MLTKYLLLASQELIQTNVDASSQLYSSMETDPKQATLHMAAYYIHQCNEGFASAQMLGMYAWPDVFKTELGRKPAGRAVARSL